MICGELLSTLGCGIVYKRSRSSSSCNDLVESVDVRFRCDFWISVDIVGLEMEYYFIEIFMETVGGQFSVAGYVALNNFLVQLFNMFVGGV